MKKISLPERKKAQKIELIIHDALHYFEKNGYYNTTVEQLCDAAMISTSTFFNYFGTKEKVVELIMEDGLKDFREIIEKSMAEEPDPFDAVSKSMMFLCGQLRKYCNTVSAYFSLTLQNDEFRKVILDHSTMAADMVLEAFAKSGRTCPLSRDLLIDVLGGCITNPFLLLPPEKAAARAKESMAEIIEVLRNH